MTDAIGAQYPQPDPRGWLVFHGLPDDLQRAEDSTQAHDYHRYFINADPQFVDIDNVAGIDNRRWYWVRPATSAERTLLQSLGYTLPDPLDTYVSWQTETLRCRRWPALETQEVTP